jgi:hypothetical protein
MIEMISEVRTRVEFDGGQLFERFVRWDGACTSFDELKKNMIYAQEHKVVSVRQVLVLNSGVEVSVPIHEALNMLPDRTGVLVVFDKEPSKFSSAEAPWFFDFPNNAAIYNADGTLRFQLHNPEGKGSYIGAVHSGAMPNHADTLGVLVGTVGHDPEWLYLVDCNSPELIHTGKWIRY